MATAELVHSKVLSEVLSEFHQHVNLVKLSLGIDTSLSLPKILIGN